MILVYQRLRVVIMRKHYFLESNLKDEFSYYKDKGRVCLWFLYMFLCEKSYERKITFNVLLTLKLQTHYYVYFTHL